MHSPNTSLPPPIREAKPPFLRLEGIQKFYGGKCVLRNVSFCADKGDFVVVLGPSGSGKSTLFRCITRLTEPTGGKIHYAQRNVSGLRSRGLREFRREVGFVFQQFNLVKRSNAINNVLAGALADTPFWRVALGRFRIADRQRALACLDQVGMLEFAYRRVDALSGGQQQRVAIARALMQDPKMILADEPVASLDPSSAAEVLEVLKRAAMDRGITVVCTLHQVEYARRFADRIVGLSRGEIVVDKPAIRFNDEDWKSIYRGVSREDEVSIDKSEKEYLSDQLPHPILQGARPS